MRLQWILISIFFVGCGSVSAVDSDSGTTTDSGAPDLGSAVDGGGEADVASTDTGSPEDVTLPSDTGGPDVSTSVDEGPLPDLTTGDDTTVVDTGQQPECVDQDSQSCITVCNTQGTQYCLVDHWGVCWPPDETCNGLDDDCDNIVDNADDGCDCVHNTTQPCGSDEGECVPGVQTCVDGQWGDCDGTNMVLPTPEVCDELDNDCNGIIDDTDGIGCECEAGETSVCGTNVGICTTGVANCDNGFWGICDGVGPIAEVCNNQDDDCNGALDDLDGGCFDAAGTFTIVAGNALNLKIEMSTPHIDCVGTTINGCIIPVQQYDSFTATCTVPLNRVINGFDDDDLFLGIPCPGPSCICESTVFPTGGTRCMYTRVMPANSVIVKCNVGLTFVPNNEQ